MFCMNTVQQAYRVDSKQCHVHETASNAELHD